MKRWMWLALLLGGCTGEGFVVERLIGPEGGEMELDWLRLSVRSGAVPQPVYFGIVSQGRYSTSLLSETPMYQVLLPGSLTEPAQISMRLPPSLSETEFTIWGTNDAGVFEVPSGGYSATRRLAQVTKSGLFGLARAPDGEASVAFNTLAGRVFFDTRDAESTTVGTSRFNRIRSRDPAALSNVTLGPYAMSVSVDARCPDSGNACCQCVAGLYDLKTNPQPFLVSVDLTDRESVSFGPGAPPGVTTMVESGTVSVSDIATSNGVTSATWFLNEVKLANSLDDGGVNRFTISNAQMRVRYR